MKKGIVKEYDSLKGFGFSLEDLGISDQTGAIDAIEETIKAFIVSGCYRVPRCANVYMVN